LVQPAPVVWRALFQMRKCCVRFFCPLEFFIHLFHECVEWEGLFAQPCTNRLSAATHLASCCTWCNFVGFPIVNIARIFSGFSSIPLHDTRNPSSCPAGTPKEQLVEFNFSLYLSRLSKVFLKSPIRDSSFLVVITSSLMYTWMFHPISLSRQFCIILW
jgi:hypothetical protein